MYDVCEPLAVHGVTVKGNNLNALFDSLFNPYLGRGRFNDRERQAVDFTSLDQALHNFGLSSVCFWPAFVWTGEEARDVRTHLLAEMLRTRLATSSNNLPVGGVCSLGNDGEGVSFLLGIGHFEDV